MTPSLTSPPYTFAIVGLGPRGSHAAECLVRELAEHGRTSGIRILAFDETGHLGTSPVYATDQLPSNWINITERRLDLHARRAIDFGPVRVPGFPGYHAWAGLDVAAWSPDRVDTFPPRAHVGRYLEERCRSLIEPLEAAGIFAFIGERIDRLTRGDDGCELLTASGTVHHADDVLLTIGHQPAHPDDQLREWIDFAEGRDGVRLEADPYPVGGLRVSPREGDEPCVAIRGFGLTMIDVARGMAERYGRFVDDEGSSRPLRYEPGARRFTLVPFSRDGLPPSPKPLTPALDARYAPSSDTVTRLDAALRDRDAQAAAEGADFLIELVAPVIAERFRSLPEPVAAAPRRAADPDLESIVTRWLADETTRDPLIMSHELDPAVALRRLVEMGSGETSVCLDYCAGQVWRHLRPTIYAGLAYSALADDVLAAIIELDERMGRYASGPPVESLRQLESLERAGVLDLRFLHDPEITCDPAGWRLSRGDAGVTAGTMINAVLDGPKIRAVRSSIVEHLLAEERIRVAHDELGALTDENASLLTKDDGAPLPIALLGRLAKGTVIGVDAMLECFGDRPRRWAAAAVRRASGAAPG